MACVNTTVRVKQGQLRGLVEKNVYGEEFLAFRGIPYAKPPVGPLRFKDPVPAEPWTGTRDASKFGNNCAQLDMLSREFVGHDDCLYLNVYRPINDSSKRAVMVWIHGGGFVNGSGDEKFYGADYLVQKDVVLVTINYRVGVLGFLTLEHEVATGNQGLKDQVLALKWVRDNISSFGGDPNNVTIFGESAGGAAIHYLTISPLSQGLFHKAISQSGVSTNPWAIISKEPSKYAYQLAAQLGEHSTDPATVVEFLRNMDAEKLVNTEALLMSSKYPLVPPERRHVVLGLFLPTIDDKSPSPFLPEHPSVLMRSGTKVPYLLGYNQNEGAMFINPLLTKFKLEDNIPSINENFELTVCPETLQAMKRDGISSSDLKRVYFGDKPFDKETIPNYVDFLSDMMFLQGIYQVVDAQMETGSQPTYLYKFTYDNKNTLIKHFIGDSTPGPTHGEELACLFYSHFAKQFDVPPPEPGTEPYKVMQCFLQMWTDFAKTGNPTPKTTELVATAWKPLEKGNVYNYLNIGSQLKMQTESKNNLRSDWKKMKNKL